MVKKIAVTVVAAVAAVGAVIGIKNFMQNITVK